MIGFLYPGQGSQHPGMLAALPDAASVVDTLAEVSAVLGHDVLELDSVEALSGTVAAQLALLTAGVACTRLLAESGIRPDAVAGHSIGAFAAAVEAGVITLAEAVRAVRVRAEGMRDLYPSGYGMLALVGARRVDAERLVNDVRHGEDLFLAMENAEDQLVLAGSDEALGRAVIVAARFGFRQATRLDVAVPSHCTLMEPVARSVAAALEAVPVRRPSIRYLSAMTARSAATGAAVRDDLCNGVARMVRWRDTTDLFAELGASVAVQLSPGHTTAALFRTAHPSIPVIALDDAPFADSVTRIRQMMRDAD